MGNQICTNLSVFSDPLNPELKTNSFVQFLGPSFPTTAEVKFYESMGNVLLGICGLSIVYACSAAGIATFGYSMVVHSLPSFDKAEISASMIESINNEMRNVAGKEISSSAEISRPSDPLPLAQIDYEIVEPVQAKPGVVEAIKEAFSSEASLGLVIDEYFFESFQSVLQNLAQLSVNTSETICPVYSAVIGDTPVFIVRQNMYHNQGYELSQVVASVKALSTKVKKLIFATNVASTSSDVNVGDIISVIDHVNVSARNPLYGHQIQGWGVRFPDMSTIYTKTELDNVKAVSVAQHVGPLFYSPVEAALAR